MRLILSISPSILIITATGFTATIAQIIMIRELLVFFYGNELSAGLIFCGWLLWSGLASGLAGKWAEKIPSQTYLACLMLVCLAAILPLCVLFIRGTRIIWMLASGELISLGKMLVISFAATGLFCPASGALFGICWAVHRKTSTNQAIWIYLAEALGAASGGLFFYFVFIPHGSVVSWIWVTSGMILFVSWWLFRPWVPVAKLRAGHFLWIAVLILVSGSVFFGSEMEHRSRRWQWGTDLLAVHDTAYHNVALLKKDGQVSVFANGLWLFSESDRLSAEHGAHLALLQHPNPKTILLLGGGVAGLLEELLKHPGIRHIDYVEPDPDFIDFLKPYLSSATNRSLHHPFVRLFNQDPRNYLQHIDLRYDVILMNMGDPITAQMNRFYTQEFFADVKQRLIPGGIFSFAVSGGESMLGPTQIRFLGSINKTLVQIFAETLIYPGDHIRFFATDKSGELLSDYAVLTDRISQRGLQLAYIRKDTLADALNPFRLNYMTSVLQSAAGAAVNRDFFPICYFNNLLMWAAQWHDVLQECLRILLEFELRWFWAVLAFVGAVIVSIFWAGRFKLRTAVFASVFATGAIMMVLQVILLLSFQIMAGFLYRQLALIIAFFMAGLAGGAGWIFRHKDTEPKTKTARRFLIRVQMLLCMLPLGLMLFLHLFHEQARIVFSPEIIGLLFSGLSLIIGVLGGMHFGLAVSVTASTGVAVEKIGGALYALDLTGSAAGALIASLFMIPIYGLMNTLVVVSLMSAFSALTLLKRP